MKKIIITILAFTLFLCSCTVASKNVVDFQNNLLEGNLYEAKQKYSSFNEEEQSQANEILTVIIKNVKESYKNKKIDFYQAEDTYAFYNGFFSEQIGNVIEQDQKYVQNHHRNEKAMTSAQEYFSQGNYAEALSQLRMIDSNYEEYSQAQNLIEQYLELYITEMKAKCQNYSNDLSTVLKIISDSRNIVSNDDMLDELESEYINAFITKTLEKAEVASDFEKSIEIIKQADKVYSCSKFKDAISDYEYKLEQYKEQQKLNTINSALAKAESLANQKKWEQAVAALESLDKNLQTNEVKEKIKLYKKYYTKLLIGSDVHSKSYYSIERNIVDAFGNEYKKAIQFSGAVGATKNPYVEYKIDGYYNKFTFSIAPTDYNLKTGIVRIYCDGKLVKEYKNLQSLKSAINDSIDINNAVFLKIEAERSGAKILIGDPTISNE